MDGNCEDEWVWVGEAAEPEVGSDESSDDTSAVTHLVRQALLPFSEGETSDVPPHSETPKQPADRPVATAEVGGVSKSVPNPPPCLCILLLLLFGSSRLVLETVALQSSTSWQSSPSWYVYFPHYPHPASVGGGVREEDVSMEESCPAGPIPDDTTALAAPAIDSKRISLHAQTDARTDAHLHKSARRSSGRLSERAR